MLTPRLEWAAFLSLCRPQWAPGSLARNPHACGARATNQVADSIVGTVTQSGVGANGVLSALLGGADYLLPLQADYRLRRIRNVRSIANLDFDTLAVGNMAMNSRGLGPAPGYKRSSSWRAGRDGDWALRRLRVGAGVEAQLFEEGPLCRVWFECHVIVLEAFEECLCDLKLLLVDAGRSEQFQDALAIELSY